MLDLAYLDDEEASLLPRRDTMLTIVLPVIEVGVAVAANNALALNAATIASFASATAGQAISLNF
jgi:hypothetical protein